MDQATQQNAALVEQSTAASGTLNEQAHGLSRIVVQFKLRHADARA
jgi:methyl-accepting chemotaxis protein